MTPLACLLAAFDADIILRLHANFAENALTLIGIRAGFLLAVALQIGAPQARQAYLVKSCFLQQ